MNIWHDERGRFTFAHMAAKAQIRRTLRHVRSASDDELQDVFLRITMRARRGRRDDAQLALLDAELLRRAAGGEPDPTPEQRRVDELVAGGASWEEAYREAYGDRGQSATSTRAEYRERAYLSYLAAEQDTRGHLLNRAGRAAGIDPRRLFTGPRAYAMKYASDELVDYWRRHPRRTFAEHRAERAGDTTGARRARAARAQAGNGRDR